MAERWENGKSGLHPTDGRSDVCIANRTQQSQAEATPPPAVTRRLIIMLKQAFPSFLMHGRSSSINRETEHLHFNAYFMENANPVLNKNGVNINCSGKKLSQEIIQTHANPCSAGPSTQRRRPIVIG